MIELNVEHFRLACEAQWLKVRDGDSLAATLVAHLTMESQSVTIVPVRVRSSGPHLLLEFFSGVDPSTNGANAAMDCRGGFLAHAQQLGQSAFLFLPAYMAQLSEIASVALTT